LLRNHIQSWYNQKRYTLKKLTPSDTILIGILTANIKNKHDPKMETEEICARKQERAIPTP